jgi:hypothetical protein
MIARAARIRRELMPEASPERMCSRQGREGGLIGAQPSQKGFLIARQMSRHISGEYPQSA